MSFTYSGSLAPIALLLSLVLEGSPAVVFGQSMPPSRTDRAGAEHRALPVATYHGGEVTVGELEDEIANWSRLAQSTALEPATLRDLLRRTLQFELMAREAERRGYATNPRVVDAVKQNAVSRFIEHEVGGDVTAEGRPVDQLRKAREAQIEQLIVELRRRELSELHPELIELIQFEDPPERATPK